MTILADMRTRRFWRHFVAHTLMCLGLLSTILQTTNVILPSLTIFQGLPILIGVISLSLIWGIYSSWPQPIAEEYLMPATKITIVKGDLLKEESHIVIGANDTFDTETPTIISRTSLQGQVLERLFNNDLKELDKLLESALSGKPVISQIAKPGKQNQYGIGTVATVKSGPRHIYFLAYCELDVQNTAHSTPDKIWKSLLALWETVTRTANQRTISVPVVGQGLARISSYLPAQDSIRFIALSFMLASRQQKICDELRIVVQPALYERLDRLELQAFLSSLRAS